MKYMIDTFNPKANRIDFENSIFKEPKVQHESGNDKITGGVLSESAQQNILQSSIKNQNKFKIRENYIKDGMSKVLCQVLFKSFYDSIYVDESFKSDYKDALFNELKESIDSLNSDIFDTYKQLSKKSDFLSEICSFCLEAVKKKEKEKDVEEEFPNEFELDEDLVHDIDDYIENNDDLSDLNKIVKDKVADTIAKEKEKNEEEQKLLDDVVAESVLLIKNPNKALEEYSLFKSFVISSYKEALKENAQGYFSENERGEKKADMNRILAEAVVKYTLYEFFNTANIQDYSPTDVKNICENLVYES